MVMPYLRSFDDPEFELIGEVVEFVRQMLEVRFPHVTTRQIKLSLNTLGPRVSSFELYRS